MKTTNESLSKRGSRYPFAALCMVLFMTALSLIPVHRAQADPSLLTGSYVIREFSAAFHGNDPNGGWGSNDEWNVGSIVVTFDGLGGFEATSTESGFRRQISEVSKNVGTQSPDYVLSNKFYTTQTFYTDPGVSGTYEITADGRFTLSFQEADGPGSVSGWVSQNGQTVVFGENQYEPANSWSRVSLGVGVKKGTGMPPKISATYAIHEFGGGFSEGDQNGGWGSSDERYLGNIEITFNSDGTFTVTHSSSGIIRQISEVSKDFGGNQVLSNKFLTTSSADPSSSLTGTYNITPEGQFTLTFTGEGAPPSLSGWVSANGQSVVFGKTEYESLNWAGLSLGVGVKKGSGLDISVFYGAYGIFTFESGVHSPDPNGGWGSGDDLGLEQGFVIFNPDGTWSVSSSQYELNRQIWEVTPPWSGEDQVLSNKFSTTRSFYPNSEGGAYDFSSDGILTLHFVDDDGPGTVTVYFSEDGQSGIFGFHEFSGATDYYGGVGLGVAVRKAVQDVPLRYSTSGVVTYTGGLTGTLKVLAFYNNGGTRYPYGQVVGTPYVETWNPTDGTQAYTITGLPAGTYQILAYVDADGTGPRMPGEPVATKTGITVTNGNLTGQNLTLAAPAFQFSGQEKVLPFNMNNVANLTFWARIPDASGVQVTGPGIASPINLGHDTMDGSVWSSAVPVSSLAGGVIQTGSYQFTATPALSGSQVTTSFNLTTVPSTLPVVTLVSPYNQSNPNVEMFLTDNKPTFTWITAADVLSYHLRIDQMIDSQWVRIYDSRWEVTGTTHTAQMPLPSGVPLRWYVDAFNGADWPSSTAMSRSVRQRFTIAGPRSISGTVNVPTYDGSGPIYVTVFLSEDGTFNPIPENLLGTDVISADEYNAGSAYYVVPNLPVGALVYVAARWDADGDGVPSEGDYLGKVGPLTVTANGLLDVNLSLETRYAYQEGAPYFGFCNVQAFNTPTGMQASFTVQVFDPNGSVPDTIASLSVTGPSQTYSFEFAPSEAMPGNIYWHGIPDLSPQLGWYTFTVTDNEGKTATSRCYWPGGTYIPVPSSGALQASGNALTPTLSWAAPSNYSGNLFYRARIFDSTGVNTIWTSGFISGTSMNVPAGILSQGLSYQWRVEAFNNYRYEASNHRAASGKVALTIDDSKPYFNYATIFHRKDSGGDKTMVQASVVAPGGALPASIQSIDVYTPQGALLYSLQAGNYDAGFNEYSYAFLGTPATGIYRFVVTDTNANTKTTYDYVSFSAIPIVDTGTLQTSGDASAPTLSWGAPAGMDRPLYYRAIVEQDLGGGVFSRVWASSRITDTFVQVPAGKIPAGTIVWYVRTLDDENLVHFSNQGRSVRVNLADNFANTNTKPYFRRAAVFKRHEPAGTFIFMDAMVNDPNGSVPDTIDILKVTDPDGVEYNLLPPNGIYNASDHEFFLRVPGTPTQGVYTFTVQDTEGNTAVTRDWVGTADEVPLVDSASISITGNPLTPTISWSAVSGYVGNLYYRIYVQDSQGNVVYRSAREPLTVQTVPAGILQPGRSYSVRIEAQDHWIWTVYNSRSNSDFVAWLSGEGAVSVSGVVRDSAGSPIPNVWVYAQSAPCGGQGLGGTNTDENGNYALSGLPEGNVYIRACPTCSGLQYADEWYDGADGVYDCNSAMAVSVVSGQETTGIDFSLDMGGKISGYVFDESGVTPIQNVHVYAADYSTNAWIAGNNTGADGHYSIVVPSGTYRVNACATCSNLDYINEYYNNTGDYNAASGVTVVAPQEISGINFTLTAVVERLTNEQSIGDGLAWLAQQQNQDGSWGGVIEGTQYELAKTGLAVLAFEKDARTQGKSPLNPTDNYQYRINVTNGLNFIFANASTISINLQPAGNPDGDGDGLGVYFDLVSDENHSLVTYYTSIAAMAIAASGEPGEEVNVTGSAVDGWTYLQVLQDVVDYLAWGQTDSGNGRGGWNYQPTNNESWQTRSDQSNTGWVALALAYAEAAPPDGLGVLIPGFVRSELELWINAIQDPVNGDEHDGGSYYQDAFDGMGANTLRTGNLLQEMAFVGDTAAESTRVQAAIDYVVRHWQGEWEWANPLCYHSSYTTMKGLESLGVETIGAASLNWYQDLSNKIRTQQSVYGWWPVACFDDGDKILSTAWAILTLQKAVAPTAENPDLEITNIQVNEGAGTYTVSFTVKNKGNLAVPAGHDVRLTVDGVWKGDWPIGVALNPGETFSGTYETPLTLTGESDQITVCADITQEVTELNEDNNCLSVTWPPPVPGDVNGDRAVTLADAIMVLKLIAGVDPDGGRVSADVNADGKIDLVELLFILQSVAGLRP